MDGVFYETGAIINTTAKLNVLFPNHFEKVHPDDLPPEPKKKKTPVEEVVDKVAEEELGASTDLDLSVHGNDITAKFDGCNELVCMVFVKPNPEKPNKKIYTVVGEDGEVWNDEPLTSKKKTQAFIDEQELEEDDED